MRLFAALPLPAGLCAELSEAFSRARALAPRLKWVSSDGMHVTLHFFGEVSEERLAGFDGLFADPALQRLAIRAQLGQADHFPGRGEPRVLWVGLKRGEEEMREFWGAFTERLVPLRAPSGPLNGWSPDARGFSPHVTIARAGQAPLSTRWAQEVRLPEEEFLIEECILFQSMLGPGGARYVPLRRITFRKEAA